MVAPARERGLKCAWRGAVAGKCGRSRKGAWIEIAGRFNPAAAKKRRSRKGAWIEIDCSYRYAAVSRVAPARERGLK